MAVDEGSVQQIVGVEQILLLVASSVCDLSKNQEILSSNGNVSMAITRDTQSLFSTSGLGLETGQRRSELQAPLFTNVSERVKHESVRTYYSSAWSNLQSDNFFAINLRHSVLIIP